MSTFNSINACFCFLFYSIHKIPIFPQGHIRILFLRLGSQILQNSWCGSQIHQDFEILKLRQTILRVWQNLPSVSNPAEGVPFILVFLFFACAMDIISVGHILLQLTNALTRWGMDLSRSYCLILPLSIFAAQCISARLGEMNKIVLSV